MAMAAHDCKGMKRMRLNSGEVVDCGGCTTHRDECCLLGFKAFHNAPPTTSSSSSCSAQFGCSPFPLPKFGDAHIMDAKSGSEETDLTEVQLNLALTIIPTSSAADSVLTSTLPSSYDRLTASESLSCHKVADVLNPAHGISLPSFCQESTGLFHLNPDLPMIDEGSTSNGCLVLPFLKAFQVSKAPCSEAREFDAGLNTIPDSAVDSDISMGFMAISGTTSTSGTSSGSGVGDRPPKMCRFTGCGKRARGASGLCISHGGGRRCQRLGCNKGAEGSTIFCKAHGGGRRCEYLGCTKSAEGKTDFCIAHGGGSRCLSEGCPKAARGRTGYCIRHGGGKRCQREGCTKSAEGYSSLCIAHGGGKRCQYPNCGKGAQGSTMFCKGHGGGKRCTVEGCNKGAEGSTPLCKGHGGGKRCMFDGGGVCSKSVHGGTLYCVAHGGGKRCIVAGCTKSARGRTDCCVKHGGGKRCKFENCDKSAQGSTDFCKAHGGGKRCSWGQESFTEVNCKLAADLVQCLKFPCDKTAKGKLGLCAEHSALVQDQRVHGIGTFAGNLLSQNENRNNSLSNIIGCNCEDGRKPEQESLFQFSEGKKSFRQGSGGMQDVPWHVSQPQLCPKNQGFQANNGVFANYIPPCSRMHTPSTKSFTGTQLPSWTPYFGVSSIHRPSIHRQAIERATQGQGGSSRTKDDEVFDMSSLSLPEERVHGGNILALLSGGHEGGGKGGSS